jgi:hypothetical protein
VGTEAEQDRASDLQGAPERSCAVRSAARLGFRDCCRAEYRARGLLREYRSYDPLWRAASVRPSCRYIASWLEMLKREKGAISSAGVHALGAVDFLHGFAAARKRCHLISGLSLWQTSGVCPSELRYTRAAAGPHPARSILLVVRVLNRRPVCRVWLGHLPFKPGGLTLIRRSPVDFPVPSVVLGTAALKPTRPALRYVLLSRLPQPCLRKPFGAAGPPRQSTPLAWERGRLL